MRDLLFQLALINGVTLKRLRVIRGVSEDFLATKARISITQLRGWEHSDPGDYPTINQAEAMANVLLCPLAGLYLEPNKLKETRKPPISNKRIGYKPSYSDDSALNLAVEDLLLRREDILELAKKTGPEILSCDLPYLESDVVEAAKRLREWIDYPLSNQISSASSRVLYKSLRSLLEERGICVAQFSEPSVDELRGISLYFEMLPIAAVNQSDRWPAKCFSLLHEMVHLCYRKSTTCSCINAECDDAEEVYCNAVAGEFLFSRQTALHEINNGLNPSDFHSFDVIANKYSISRDVVARRVYDIGQMSRTDYEELLDLFRREAIESSLREKAKAQESGRTMGYMPYEKKMVDYHGALYCVYVNRALSLGVYSEYEAASALGVKPDSLGSVFKEAFG